MKKYNLFNIVLTVVITVFTIQGCSEKSLDVPFAKETADSFFSEGGTESYDKAIIGGYAKLSQFYKNLLGATYLQAISLMRDDLITSNLPDPFEVYGSLNATNNSVTIYYRLGYQLVNRMNLTLEYLDLYGDKVFGSNTELKNFYEGEARFLRAYMYFHLAINFDTPPLLKNTIVDLAYLPKNSNKGEVLDYAISELAASAELLPSKWSGINIGRATKGSAYGMLGKALLHKASSNNYDTGDLNAALDAFNQVEGLGYTLLSNFADNFDGNNENNGESVFEVQFGVASSGSNNIWVPVDDFDSIGDLGGFWGFFNYHWSAGGRFMLPTTKLESYFEDGDPRKDMTVRDGQIKKYIDKDVSPNGGVTSSNNARILRYSDILLMKAEAMLMSGGNKGEAIALINMVRERARNSVAPASAFPADRNITETDENTILQWIMDERVVELAAEESWRWYDLIRWNNAGKINLSSWDFSSTHPISFDVNKNLLLPFPASEVSVSNGSLNQNPNY